MTLTESVTLDFYAWEIRGRGWQVSPYPVDLEPPYRPFFLHSITASRAIDDAKRPTALGAAAGQLADLVRGPRTGLAPERTEQIAFEEPLPEPRDYSDCGKLREVQVALPPDSKVSREASERLLTSLGFTQAPVSFEILSLPDTTFVQLACREADLGVLESQLSAHFPDAVLGGEAKDFLQGHWRPDLQNLVVDFGLSEEFMRPLSVSGAFSTDSLTGVIGALAHLEENELAVLQVLFQGTRHSWRESILRSVVSEDGSSFFADAPEMAPLAREKAERPLFAALLRVGIQSKKRDRIIDIARAIAGSLLPFARPGSNELMPLQNEDYDPALHVEDLLERRTCRSGMILNSAELVSLVHLPSESVRTEKLKRELRKTRSAPEASQTRGLVLGENTHRGKATAVVLPAEQRLRHMHVLGATGTGKSTLLLNLILQDIQNGEGVGVIDPHGDLIDEILKRIPERRYEDVILFDPADDEFPIGFNILEARSALERRLLESDLGALFERFTRNWGDQMTAVLSNAVAAFLASDRGGTLADLRRFLVDAPFRQGFLASVRDPAVLYFWSAEFPILKGKSEASIVIRLGTFMRSGIVRNILSQRDSRLDFSEIVNGGRVLLGRLPKGAIGEESSYLLGSLLVSKIYQVAIARQNVPEPERRNFFLYIDEFQNFVTPSLKAILTEARKYHLGLVLAHHNLEQLSRESEEMVNSVLGTETRVCFQLSGPDARKVAEGFSSFDARDFQQLDRREAIAKIGRADRDFNLKTYRPPEIDAGEAQRNVDALRTRSRERYARRREEVEKELFEGLERASARAPSGEEERRERRETRREQDRDTRADRDAVPEAAPPSPRAEKSREEAPRPEPASYREPAKQLLPTEARTPGRGGKKHKEIQSCLKHFAQDRGFRATIERQVPDGRVDLALEGEGVSVACEISIATDPEHELQNVRKCLAAGFTHVVVVSPDVRSLKKIRDHVSAELEKESLGRVRFLSEQGMIDFVEELAPAKSTTTRGWKVKAKRRLLSEKEGEARKKAIAEILIRSSKRQKGPE